MAGHLEAVARDLGHVDAGVNRALSLVGLAGQHLQKSVDAAVRGGFAATAANLQGAQQQLRQLHGLISGARAELGQATGPVAAAPKEVDAGQIAALLSPLPGQLENVRSALQAAIAQLPPVVQRVAASANRNPAIGVLTEAGQQVLSPTLQRVMVAREAVVTALTEARTAQTGE